MMFKTIFLSLTTRCDIYCEKCWRRKVFGGGKDISSEVLYRFFKLMKDESINIILGSGENTICSQLETYIDWISTTNNTTTILTTGKNLNKIDHEKYYSNKIKWGITFDGFYNEDIKNMQYGIDLQEVKKNIKYIKKKYKNANMYLNYTLTSSNIDSLKEFIDFAKEVSISEVYITPIKAFDNFNEDKIIPVLVNLDSEEVIEKLRLFSDYGKTKDILLRIPKRDKEFITCLKTSKPSPIIDIDGNVSFCYGRENTPIGNIFDDNIWEVHNKLLNALNSLENTNQYWCSKCSSKIKSDKGLYFIPYDIK